MFIPDDQGASASTGGFAEPPDNRPIPHENVRHMLFGRLSVVQATIKQLHHLNYAEPNDWSKPISTGRPNEVMAILTKRVNIT
ncbi:hypothetical protein [Leptolyngbya sp. BC1307]|uniref:hypothetical protein n=1 Tax=Leptolyngbya sp. BC1307 TaxID=2029589 RepID=UPI000EFA6435|nr:hypothetical protein [Leptolyngbya sp. BC1307]